MCLICILSILHWREQVIRDAAEIKTGENEQKKIYAGYAYIVLRKDSCPTKGFFPFLGSRSFPLARKTFVQLSLKLNHSREIKCYKLNY